MGLTGQHYAPAALNQARAFVADLIGGWTASESIRTLQMKDIFITVAGNRIAFLLTSSL
jgi:hypothetical protein